MLKRAMMLLILIGALSVPIGPGYAGDAPVSCPSGQAPNRDTGECVIVVTPPTPDDPPDGPADPSGGGGGAAAPTKCLYQGKELPCEGKGGWWSNGRSCYVSAATKPPGHPAWGGNHPEGGIYRCTPPGEGPPFFFWSATVPTGAAAPPDPAVLAQQAIATMSMGAIDIGIVPEPRPGSVGVIGMPTWMWAKNPGASTLGPITKSASAGGYTVQATAKVDRIVWDMGDGTTVTCTGKGTPYKDSYGKSDSPTCGHTYTTDGKHDVTATSYWAVEWEGIGQSGTINLDFSRSTTVNMGEVQVLTR